MHRIALLYLLLFACSVYAELKNQSIPNPNVYAVQLNTSIFEQNGWEEAVNKKGEPILPVKYAIDSTLDTIYFPFYNGVQMIMVGHTKLYNDLYGMQILRSMRMSQMPYFPPEPQGDEYFFRDLDGNVVKAFNTAYSLEELTLHFQSVIWVEEAEHYHVQYFLDTNQYYPSENMDIHNGFYIIINGAVKQHGSAQLETSFTDKSVKYGLIDTLGNVILDTLYDEILSLPHGFLVQKGGKWGILDKKQQVVLPFEYDRHKTGHYYFDNYPMSKELTYLFKNGCYKVAYFMKNDSLIFLKDYYQVLEPYKGLFIITENGKYGIVDLVNNKIVLPPVYEGDYPYFQFHDPNREFYHSEHAYVIAVKNGKYGMINLKNKIILPFKYDEIYNKHESRAGYFKVVYNGKIIEIED